MILGLSEIETEMFKECLQTWQAKAGKNRLLSVYYDSRQALRDLGISLPPNLGNVNAALGWPEKAVSALARKHVFEGFSRAGETDPFDLNSVLVQNEFSSELVQAITSAYKHSCAFLTVTKGGLGEPDVVIQARSAEDSTALWDSRARSLKAGFAVTETHKNGLGPKQVLFFTRDAVITLDSDAGGWRVVDRQVNRTGQVLMVPIVYDPQLGRPFGRSRITREVRYLTDAAIRTMLRAEVSAEFYASPQRWVMGAAEDAFDDHDRWSAILGRMLALKPNEDGNLPTVGQFPQMSMDPHWSMYRQFGQNFCSATGLPMSSVGLFSDNPASAEAMQAAEARLADEAEYQWRIFTPRLLNVLGLSLMIRDNQTVAPAELWDTNVNWTPARYVSPQASSDWAVKAVSADPSLQGSKVVQRRLGLSQGEIEEVEAERASRSAERLLDQVLAGD